MRAERAVEVGVGGAGAPCGSFLFSSRDSGRAGRSRMLQGSGVGAIAGVQRGRNGAPAQGNPLRDFPFGLRHETDY